MFIVLLHPATRIWTKSIVKNCDNLHLRLRGSLLDLATFGLLEGLEDGQRRSQDETGGTALLIEPAGLLTSFPLDRLWPPRHYLTNSRRHRPGAWAQRTAALCATMLSSVTTEPHLRSNLRLTCDTSLHTPPSLDVH